MAEVVDTAFWINHLTTFPGPQMALCRGKIPTFGFRNKAPIIWGIFVRTKGKNPNELVQRMWRN